MSDGKLTPREALEALGYRFEEVLGSHGKIVDLCYPGSVPMGVPSAWPDSTDAARFVIDTLLYEAERNAASARRHADAAARVADEVEAKAARVRDVAGRVRQ